MRIGFDAKRAFQNRTGLGNYARTLTRNLKAYYPEEEYFYFTPHKESAYSHLYESDSVISPAGNNPLWRSFGVNRVIRESEIDIYHGLSNELPIGIHKTGVPSVVTIHDVIFDIVKEDFPWHDRFVYRIKTKKCIRESSKIIAISQATRHDLINRFKVDPGKIKVIYQTIDPQFNLQERPPDQLALFKTDYKLPEHFLLYVGALMKRKNILRMIQAWERLPEAYKIPLLIFGEGNQYKPHIEKYIRSKNLKKWIQIRPPVPFRDLPILYQLAESVIYPSLFEGFGLPVLEALACGARVVTSSVSSMPEAGGDLPVYVHPNDIESIADGIIRSLEHSHPDPVKLSEHLRKFNGAELTEQIMNLYLEVAGN